MSRTNAIIGLYTETSLHPGTGSSVGIVDLPVQREKHTDLPFIPSSSLKGCLRDTFGEENPSSEIFFGKGAEGDEGFAGAISLSDARLLAFPVRSMTNVFVWITCPLIIERLWRDLRLIGVELPSLEIPKIPQGTALVSHSNTDTDRLIIEDLLFTKLQDDVVSAIASTASNLFLTDGRDVSTRERFLKNLCVLCDEDFRYLASHGTEVMARNVLDEHKKSQNLWWVELVPRDTIFYSLVMAESSRGNEELNSKQILEKFISTFSEPYVQVGGHETLGQGWCALTLKTSQEIKSLSKS